MVIFRVKKPDLSKIDLKELLSRIEAFDIVESYYYRVRLEKASDPRYLFYDKAKYLETPKDLTPEEFWAIIKYARRTNPKRVWSSIEHEDGNYFNWEMPMDAEHYLHILDLTLGGDLAMLYDIDFHINKGNIEEAIASSQLEGAVTTRREAKKMINEKRKPKDQSEHMIFNTYQAMLAIENDYLTKPLNLDLLLQLHSIICTDTMNAKDIGRLRSDDDPVKVMDPIAGTIYHIPPKEDFLKKSINHFEGYFNDKYQDDRFIHPVIKSIIFHFWFAYLHPFVDGNGRMARLLSYWYLLKKKYWAFSYLSLSRTIKNSPAQYRNAFIFSEQDDYDLTYFMDFMLHKIMQAKRDLDKYIDLKQKEFRKINQKIAKRTSFNNRQIQLLRYLHKNINNSTNAKTHANIYNVNRITAMNDLKDLEKQGFTFSRKVGREVRYFAAEKINELFD
jgi:Fic family protein